MTSFRSASFRSQQDIVPGSWAQNEGNFQPCGLALEHQAPGPQVQLGGDVAVDELVGHGDLDAQDAHHTVRADQAHELDHSPAGGWARTRSFAPTPGEWRPSAPSTGDGRCGTPRTPLLAFAGAPGPGTVRSGRTACQRCR